ncbi:MAG TPA: hypothetical protein VIN40_08210 [Candidatus Tyrphobacter sp.]
MARFSIAFALVASFVMLLGASPMHTATAHSHVLPNGLTPGQQAELRRLQFAVVPNPLPAGFHITRVTTDLTAKTYEVDYVRARDGATIRFGGGAFSGSATASSRHPSGSHGIAGFIGGVRHLESTPAPGSQTNMAPEEEEEMADVAADSRLIGPVHFSNQGNCLAGNSDPSLAQIHDARFSVEGCNFQQPDLLIRAYKSVARP